MIIPKTSLPMPMMSVATQALVPGRVNGQSATLQAQFDNLPLLGSVFCEATNEWYARLERATYALGGRITLISSGGGGGGGGTDGVYTTVALLTVTDCVYLSAADTVAKANATDATKPAFGFVVEVISATSVVVRTFGEVTGFTGLTQGSAYYLDTVDGGITLTAPSGAGNTQQKVGFAKDATTLDAFVVPTINGGVYAQNGTAATPSHSFLADPDTGMYRSAANVIGFAANGAAAAKLSATQLLMTGGGGAPLPTFAFDADPDTGLYNISANTLGVATNGALSLSIAPTAAVLTQAVATTGTPTAWTINGGAHTTLNAGGGSPDVNFALNRTVQFATGAIAFQSAFLISPPTYGFVGASVVNTAATLAIAGAPAAGTNATLTSTFSAYFGAQTITVQDDAAAGTTVAVATLRRTVTAVNGAAGVGAQIVYQAPSTTGVNRIAGRVQGELAVATNAAEVGAIDLMPAFAGAVSATDGVGLRVQAPAAAPAVGLKLTVAATATAPILAPFGETNMSLTISQGGTGTLKLDVGATGSLQLGGNAGALIGFYGVAPVARALAVTVPNAAAAAYAQVDAATWVSAINDIIAVLKNVGLSA